MIIMLEGTDCAGKSTLANRLVEYAQSRGFTAEVRHYGVPQRHPLEEYEFDLEQMDPPTEHLVVFDRYHLGQLVYGGLYQDENLLGMGGAWHVNALLERYGTLPFIVSPPLDVVRQRLEMRGEDYLKSEHVEHVWRTYQQLSDEFSIPLLTSDLDDDDLRVLVDTAHSRAKRAEPLRQFSTYVGPRFPEILLVGDRQNFGGGEPAQHRSAFMPYPDTLGKLLCDTIVRHPILGRKRIGLVYALEDDIGLLVDTLGQPKIVALGWTAKGTCARSDVLYGSVQHPTYMRHCTNKKHEKYAEAILTASEIEDGSFEHRLV